MHCGSSSEGLVPFRWGPQKPDASQAHSGDRLLLMAYKGEWGDMLAHIHATTDKELLQKQCRYNHSGVTALAKAKEGGAPASLVGALTTGAAKE